MTREILLTKGLVALVDDADFDWLSKSKWFASEQKGGAYALRWNGTLRRNEYMHRVILGVPTDVHVDHANRDRLDNRRANLRPCTVSENRRNTPRPSASGYRGIRRRPHGSSWAAWIRCDGATIYIPGGHKTPESAARAYDAMAVKLHGEFAILNFPEEHSRVAASGGLAGLEERHFETVDRKALDADQLALFEERA